jgi:hypothetical protein
VSRNLAMARRIEARPPDGAVRFVIAGDSGAWPDPTADGIFSQLLAQVARLDPRPAFLANLGDFAGPGSAERHAAYLARVTAAGIPDVCVIGNHDLDHPDGRSAFTAAHGPTRFSFACGHARFVAIEAQAVVTGAAPSTPTGPSDADLAFLDEALSNAPEAHRVVLMHAPPHLGGHYAPHPEWGFTRHEREFLDLLARHEVRLVCFAHGLGFDDHVHDGVRFVMSGGAGSGLCSHYRGICATGPGTPSTRGSAFHVTRVTIAPDGTIATEIVRAFATA